MSNKSKKGRLSLMAKFIISLAFLGILMTVVISYVSYNESRNSLIDMYADKVDRGSKSIADVIDVADVKTIIAEGGNETEAYTRVLSLMNRLKKDGMITHLSLVVPNETGYTYYIDAYAEALGDIPGDANSYGSVINAAYDEEVAQNCIYISERYNAGKSSEALVDNAYEYSYTSCTPILDDDGTPIAAILYTIDLQSVRNVLFRFLNSLIITALVIVTAAMLLYAFVVRRILIRPVGKLADFTRDITANGEFNGKKITMKNNDEIGDLAESFNYMLDELDVYINNLARITAEKERIGAELDVAKNIQASMLPCVFPAFPNRDEFDIYATMTPAKEVGGDFYDFFMLDDRHLAIVMADVSGKGVPAALFMVIGKTLIKDHTLITDELSDVFTEVNNLLCEANSEGLFITAFEGVLDLVTGQFRFVNAGHEMPFIYRRGEGYAPYKIRAGFVLAGMENMKYRSGEITLDEGDRIFQYTDGVTEATDTHNELFGMERLQASLDKCTESTPEATLQSVKDDIDAFVGDAPQFDDITMLCLEFRKKQAE